jgi:hypothetical protein
MLIKFKDVQYDRKGLWHAFAKGKKSNYVLGGSYVTLYIQ